MRTVVLNYRPAPPDEARADARSAEGRRARLLRHLQGRLLELEEDGLRVLGPADPFALRAPLVAVDFAGRDNREMARRLEAEYRILVSCAAPEAAGAPGVLRLCPAPGVTFEDIDYVQSAVYRLLLEHS